MSHLKKTLVEAYGGFADKRIKNLAKGSTFIADDRSHGDFGADKSLFPWFCSVLVEVTSEDEVSIRLAGGVPSSPGVTAWAEANGGRFSGAPSKMLTFSVKHGSESILLSLAAAIEAIIAPGKKYSVSSYKYVCPRTAESLKKLAAALQRGWGA